MSVELEKLREVSLDAYEKRAEIIRRLADWIQSLREAAKNDDTLAISWFDETREYPLNIIGGWMGDFSESYSDIMCISKSEPKYAMCVKIGINEGQYDYVDFDATPMPVGKDGEVEDTCIALEYDDNPTDLAMFLLQEWERLMKAYKEDN